MTSSKNRQGVTLIELMVVLAVLSIVIGLIYSIFISQMQTSVWRAQLAERKQNLDGAINVMIQDFLKADSLVDIPGVCNTTIMVKDGNNYIQYRADLAAETLRRELDNDADPGTPPDQSVVVAEDITGLSFECFDKNGELKPPPLSTSEVGDIRRVTISLTGKTGRPRPGSSPPEYPETTVTTSIELRNLPQYAGSGCGVLYFTMTPTTVAFCDPPGETATIKVQLCNLIGNALGGEVRIYPKGGLPVTIEGAGVTEDPDGTAVLTIPDPGGAGCRDAGTEGTAEVVATNPSDARLSAGSGLEMVAVWRPTGCGYNIMTSRALTVEAGDPYKFENHALEISPGIINACQSETQATLRVKVTDACGNPIPGQAGVAFDVLDGPLPGGAVVTGNPAWGTIGAVTDLGNGFYSTVYNAGSVSRVVTLRATDAGIVNATYRTISNTITLNADSPADFQRVSSPFGLTLNECPGATDSVEFKVIDGCGNPISGELSHLMSSLDVPTKGTTYVGLVDDYQYKAVYNTPEACGDGNIDPSILIGHTGFANTLSAPVALGQCPMPGLDVTRTSAPPHRVSRGCGRLSDPDNPTTLVRATVRDNASCDPWPVDTKFEFEVVNCRHDPVSCVVGANENGSWEDSGTTKTVFSGTGWAEQRLLGRNEPTSTPFPPDVGDFLKVRARAWVKYDPVTGAYDAAYTDGLYTSDAANLVEVIAPPVDIRFTDSAFSATNKFISAECAGASETLYFQIDDCDADLEASVTAIVNSVAPDGSTRDSETRTLFGGGGIYNGLVATSTTAGGATNDGTLKIASADRIKVFYTDASDGTVETAEIDVSGGFDDFEGDVSGWSIAGTHVYPPNPQWHIAAIGGDKWFVYNDGTDFQPADLSTNEGTLTSPEFGIDTSPGTWLVFNSMHENECSDVSAACSWDTRYVFINSTSAPSWRLIEPVAADENAARSADTKTFNLNHPHRVGIDLSALPAADYDGKTGKLRFKFKTWDGVANNFFGWAIDDVLITCNPDVTPPAAPVITGTTVSATKVRLTWPAVADAAGYSLFVYNSDRTGRPNDVVRNLTENCVSAGKVCYEYTAASLLGTDWYFRVAAFDAAGNLSALSNSYKDETGTILDVSMTCYSRAPSGLAGGKKKYVVKGTVTNLDGTVVPSADVKFDLATAANSDTWNLTTGLSGAYCGDNETDGTPSPFGSGAIVSSAMQASKVDYTSSAVKPFANEGACSCTGDPCVPTSISYPSGAISGTINTTCISTSRTAFGTHYAKYYTFTLGAPTTVTITMAGGLPVNDPYLYLLDSGYSIIDQNDDFSGLDAQIGPILLNAGTYIIEATTYNIETGNFTLSLF